jgi:hypothetical protein
VSVAEEAQRTIVLQAFDPELDPLQLFVLSRPTYALHQVNVDGSTGAQITSIPDGGLLVTNPEGRVRYFAPVLDDPDTVLEDGFTFQAKVTGSNPDLDAACCSRVSTVSINLIPVCPLVLFSSCVCNTLPPPFFSVFLFASVVVVTD